MEITLYKNGKEFFENNLELKEKISGKIELINMIDSIKTFNNNTFIIKYDELVVISFKSKMYVFGYSDSLDEILDDLFIRNIEFRTIYTSNIKFVNLLKTKFNYKITQESKHYFVEETNIRRCLFSGGCFWCMAHPYYEFKGVLKVVSGYAGGTTLNPTYLETKHGENDYKETVLIIYDSSEISYRALLKLYFQSIDPFDSEGQFIDKGNSYKAQVYFKDKFEEEIFNWYKNDIEMRYKLKVMVLTSKDSIFYKAEDEHQEFEFKNKDKFLEEEKTSGRLDFKSIKLV